MTLSQVILSGLQEIKLMYPHKHTNLSTLLGPKGFPIVAQSPMGPPQHCQQSTEEKENL